MASGVNVKMGVSGVQQFRQNLTQAKQAVKTLDAQLALTEKQFKQTGDSESYMSEKAALLEAKLENQKAILANTEKALEQMRANGVDKASKAYQDMYRQMVQAKGAIIDTETAMDGIAEAGDDASDSVSEMNSQLSHIGQNVAWDNVTEGLEKITSGMEKVIKKAWNVGKAIVDATLGAGAWADELQATADQYEITPEQLYRMRQVADLIDTDADTILAAQDKLAKNNSKKSEDFMGALAFLKIDPTGKKNLDLFWEAGEAIMALGENEDKAYYAQQIFGKSWRELLPLFKAGREEYDKAFGEANWVGDENFQSLTALDDASQKLNNSWETLQQTFLGTLAGPMKDVFELLNGVLEEFNEYLQSDEGKKALKQMGETIKDLIKNLVSINPEDVANGLKTVVEKITEAFKWIDEHKNDVKTALEVIAGGFVVLKLGTVASNIAKIVSGFQTLWNGANKPLPGAPSVPGAPTGGGGGGGGWFAGLAGSIKGTIASNGMSLLTPAAVIAAAVLPALKAQDADERRLEEKRAVNLEAAEKLKGTEAEWWLTRAAEERSMARKEDGSFDKDWTGRHYINEGENVLDMLLGMQNRSDLQKMQLHNMIGQDAWNNLQQVWKTGGYGMDAFEVTALFDTVTDAYAKMADQTADITGASEKQEKSAGDMSEAAGSLQKMPAQVEAAIIRGMSGIKIYIDGQQAGSAITPYVNSAMGGILASLTR